MGKKKNNNRRDKFWSGSGKFFLFIILVYLAFYSVNYIFEIAAVRSDYYQRSDIEINGNRMISDAQILKICGFYSNKDTERRINIDSVASVIMKLRYVKGISITKRPPQILNITIDEYEPVAFIYGRGLNLIDAEGYLIPLPNADIVWDLPHISGITEKLGTLGKRTTASDAYIALEIVRYLEDENPLLAGLVSEINLSSKKDIELYLIKGGTKIRISRELFYKELYVLKNYIANYLDWRQLTNIEYIDLRFENQLIIKPKT